MKTAFSLLILFLFCLKFEVRAQTTFGVKTGVHLDYSIRSADNVPAVSSWKRKDSNSVSPLFGVYAKFELGQHFSLQTELMGLQKTWQSDLDFSTQEERFKMTYLNIPFLFILHDKRFGLELGPGFNYLLLTNNSSDSNTLELRSSQIELSVNAGLHYYFKKWTLGARLAHDLTPFYTSRQLEPNRSTADYYHHVYQFSIARQL